MVAIPAWAAHVAFLAVSRAGIYRLLGTAYTFDFTAAHLLYEWRKDLLSVFIFASIGFIADRLAHPVATPPPPAAFRIEVRDGARKRWFYAAEIEFVEAAGNYVELHTPTGPVLYRTTLAALSEQLVPLGFARIHRSRLVRRDAIIALMTTPSGDFEVRLASGATVAGSRRFRDCLNPL